METKICKKCGRELPTSNFAKRNLSPDGYSNTCNACLSEKLSKSKQDSTTTHKINSNPDLKAFTPRELIEELKARGYKGKLTIAREIIL
jgi:hypothetical protein